MFSKRNMSDFTMHFGQFFSHDNDLSTPLPRQDFMQFHQNQIWMPINIPKVIYTPIIVRTVYFVSSFVWMLRE